MTRTVKYVLFGLLMGVICMLVFAPAVVVKRLLERQPGVLLGAIEGTLWRGAGRLSLDGQALGRLEWRLSPLSLVTFEPLVNVSLDAPSHDLDGRITAGAPLSGSLTGTLEGRALDALLNPYEIDVNGHFEVEALEFAATADGRIARLDGEIRYAGGAARYRLSGRTYRRELPPLVAFLDSGAGRPEMTVYRQGSDVPLILARLKDDGWVSVGITRQFTILMGQPWPGSEPVHGVVVEVEEQLF